MVYIPTQEDVNLVLQTDKDLFIKIDLLNKDFKTIGSLQANLISDNLSVDSESKQRRSYSCELQVSDRSFLIGSDKKIWIDKYIRPYYGIKNRRTKEINYYLLGTFSYQSASYTFNATTNRLSIKCPDLMADYDGTKNGQISDYELLIPAGQSIKKSVKALLDMAGVTKYAIEESEIETERTVPYDLEFSGTFTYCDVWTRLSELYEGWKFFFDIDGTFVWRKIQTGLFDPVAFDNAFLDKILISENLSYDFSKIYNKTVVWGKVLDLEHDDRYTEDCTFSGGIYNIVLEDVTKLEDIDHLDQIGIKISADSIGNDMVKINDCEAIPIVDYEGNPIAKGRLKKDKVYVFSYRRNWKDNLANCLYLLGENQCYGEYTETNIDCPFSVPNLGYEIVNRVDYDAGSSDDYCYNWAEYLTYQSTAFQDTLDIECLIIPWLEVNQKIEYKSQLTGETNQYMIKSFSWSSKDGTMSITLYKFLESFSYVKERRGE